MVLPPLSMAAVTIALSCGYVLLASTAPVSGLAIIDVTTSRVGGSVAFLTGKCVTAFAIASKFGRTQTTCGGRPAIARGMTMVTSSAMKARRKQNVDGNLFVDESCIDCDTCRWMQGRTFASAGGKSAVIHQPETEEERRGAYRAMVACPTGSIRLESPDPLVKDAQNDFPCPVDEKRLPGIFHLGFHSTKSYGCSPWFVAREAGNIMMDSPRFNGKLAKTLEERGGLSYMIISHIDDVADHQRWKDRFPEMRRVMHKADVEPYGDTSNVEVQLDSSSADGQMSGMDYWDLDDDMRILHTPGHSRGSVTFLYRTSGGFQDSKGVAFTGDHLALSGRTGALTGFPRYGWNHQLQGESMEVLATSDVRFRWILPGHGRMMHFSDDDDRISQIRVAASNIKAGRS